MNAILNLIVSALVGGIATGGAVLLASGADLLAPQTWSAALAAAGVSVVQHLRTNPLPRTGNGA